jgi:hypothetical protein
MPPGNTRYVQDIRRVPEVVPVIPLYERCDGNTYPKLKRSRGKRI